MDTEDLAIVLRSLPFDERHRIVTALTQNHGRVSALARNAIQSRRFGGALETFTASRWRFKEKTTTDLFGLQEAEVKRSFDGIRKSFDKLAVASTMTEVILRMALPGESTPQLFQLYSNALAYLDEEEISGDQSISFLNAYFSKILQWHGSQPRLHQCMGCERSLGAVYGESQAHRLLCLVIDAEWICADCRLTKTSHVEHHSSHSHDLSIPAVVDFYRFLTVPIRQANQEIHANPDQHRELLGYLVALLAYHIPGFDREPLKSLSFIDRK